MYNARVSLQTIGSVATPHARVHMGDTGTVRGQPPAVFYHDRNLDAKLDFLAAPLTFAYVTEVATSNSTGPPRVREALYGFPTFSADHGHRVLLLDTLQTVTRAPHAIKPQPMPDSILQLLDDLADEDNKMYQTSLNLPPTHHTSTPPIQRQNQTPGTEGVGKDSVQRVDKVGTSGADVELPPPARRGRNGGGDSLLRIPSTAAALPSATTFNANAYVAHCNEQDATRAKELMDILRPMQDWKDSNFVLKIAVKAAMKTREVEATASITAELKQMIKMKVWRPVRLASLTLKERVTYIRSQCFLKDKYNAAGLYEKLKARLVARGDMQDKTLYQDLSSPTVATTSVLITAAIAASEGRHCMSLDVPGAYLNADMASTGVKVRMLLDPIMTSIICKIDPSYEAFVLPNGTCLVELDKALYGTVEAAKLWYDMLTEVLAGQGFAANPYDACVFNKVGTDGNQVTICLHVDDLLVTSKSKAELDKVQDFLAQRFGDVTVQRGPVINYVGMTLDFAARPGKCEITMNHMTEEILKGSGVSSPRATPACDNLFEVRETTKLAGNDLQHFKSYVAKLLFLGKRVRPEILTAVAFLTTRVQACDIDDMGKLNRVLGYLYGCPHRGIVLDVGEGGPNVKTYIDAAYGVHTTSGKSHTGSVIVIGNYGPVHVRSGKQQLVTKSSTEAELVGLSDAATQAIHVRNFIEAQGYSTDPLTIYQDNMSCMALIKRGGPCSARSRHIGIRRFWLKERVDGGEVVIQHMPTEDMIANLLTKPVQGRQFLKERQGLTNWDR
jgi:hypothetical protein